MGPKSESEVERAIAQIRIDTISFLGSRELVAKGLASPNDLTPPPKAYALYEQVQAWNFQHLLVSGGHYDQPYLIMRQLAAVMSGVAFYENRNSNAEQEAKSELENQIAQLKAMGLVK